MARPWIKLYTEALNDPKMILLSDSAYRRFIECLLFAGETDDEGRIGPQSYISIKTHQSNEQIGIDLTELATIGIVYHEAGEWYITSWAKRQPPTTVADRVEKHRKNKRKQTGNKAVTLQKRYSNVLDKDKDKEEDEEEERARAHTHARARENGNNNSGNNWKTQLSQEENRQIEAVEALLRSWRGLTGVSIPTDPDKKREDFVNPAAAILAANGWNVSAAFEALKQKRAEMLGQGKTPFRLAAVVPYVIADGDSVGVDGSGKKWWQK